MAEKIVVLTSSQCILILELTQDEDWSSLDQLQSIVGGYIETVKPRVLHEPYLIVCNEDGLLRGYARNEAATELVYGFSDGEIVGNVVIMKSGMRNGEPDIVGMDDEEATELANELVASLPWLRIIVHE